MIVSPRMLPPIPIAETDGIPIHVPRCFKTVDGFNGFPIGFGGNQGTAWP